jgi:hypothetical protein
MFRERRNTRRLTRPARPSEWEVWALLTTGVAIFAAVVVILGAQL